MALWVVRAGRYGERESYALKHGRVVIGWDELPVLSGAGSREEVERIIREHCPEFAPAQVASHTGQIWTFLHRIETEDLIVLPLRVTTRSAIAICEVAGPYEHVADAPPGLRHGRPVRWLRTDIPRGDFDQDLLHSFGATLTVFQVSRNDAEARVRRMLDGRVPPRSSDDDVPDIAAEEAFNVEEFATDQIRRHISRKYRGHELSHLVADILRAQGYKTYTSPPGPDAGIDILAGSGAMEFDPPRIAVQVKSSDAPGDVIAALAEHYDRLPDAMQAEIPMKQVWTLVVEE